MAKKLKKSKKEKIVAGVVGGLAEYFKIDATLLRIVWLIAMAFTGVIPMALVYIVAAVIMPEK